MGTTCSTCWDYSHKWQCCLCPLNASLFGGYRVVSADTLACLHYRKGKNDYPIDNKKVERT